MSTIIALIPAIPFLSFLILALFGHKMTRKIAGIIGAGSIGIIGLFTIIVAIGFFNSLPEVKSIYSKGWEWIMPVTLGLIYHSVSILYH